MTCYLIFSSENFLSCFPNLSGSIILRVISLSLIETFQVFGHSVFQSKRKYEAVSISSTDFLASVRGCSYMFKWSWNSRKAHDFPSHLKVDASIQLTLSFHLSFFLQHESIVETKPAALVITMAVWGTKGKEMINVSHPNCLASFVFRGTQLFHDGCLSPADKIAPIFSSFFLSRALSGCFSYQCHLVGLRGTLS